MEPALEQTLQAAVRAPSGDNTQPWQFVVAPGAAVVEFQVDESRDPSPMNVGQRMARIALGATIENAMRAVRHNGWRAELEPGLAPSRAALVLQDYSTTSGAMDPVIAARATNRRLYDGRVLDSGVRAQLARVMPHQDSVRAIWIHERPRLARLAGVLARADAMMFAQSSFRRAIIGNVRFDAPAHEAVAEGLSLASLELTRVQQVALRLMAHAPDWFVRYGGGLRMLEQTNRCLIESASGLCLVVRDDCLEESDVTVGRAMQRAWLGATELGLAVQPLTSLLVLENARDQRTIGAAQRERLAALSGELRELMPEMGASHGGFLFRFGCAPPPSGRTGRLSPQTRTVLANRVALT
jgi:nitroreductase